MTREEKIAEARRMREDGATFAEIAERFGIANPTAYRWATPGKVEQGLADGRAWKAANREHTRAYDAAYAREHRGRCIRCDGQMGIGVAQDGVCDPCRHASRHERCLLLEKWWAAGVSFPEICERLNWSKGRLSSEMDRMRAEGYDFPYRYRVSGARYPDQVAA